MEFRKPSNKLIVALSLYGVLALIATFTLDGVLRTALWLFFALLAGKTIAASEEDED